MAKQYIIAPDELGPTVTLGEILVEIMAIEAGDGFLEPLLLTGPYPSGAPAIFISQCASIGGSAGMIGTVGDDDFGKVNLNRLSCHGVDITAVAVHPTLPTGSAFVRYRPNGARDFVYNISNSAAAKIEWSEKAESLITRAGHLHIMGTVLSIPGTWPLIERAVRAIKQRQGTVSLDPNLRKELKLSHETQGHFAELLAVADLVLPSGEELALATGIFDQDEAIQSLFQRGVKEIVLKQGALGATYFDCEGETAHSPAFEVDEVDPTGAGDCFGGAYVACRRLGMAPDQALLYACAAGARNVTQKGPMEGVGSRIELDEFINQNRRRN